MRHPLAVALSLLFLLPAGCSDSGRRGTPASTASAAHSATVTTGGSSAAPVGSSSPAATPPGTATPARVAPLRVVGSWLRDAEGRAVLLRGMNVSNSAKRAPYLPWQSEADLDLLNAWGFNCVRYLIQWRAVEPQPGQIDQAYLDQVAQRIGWLRDRGVFVIIDMHQDLYGGHVGGNGAPDWASPNVSITPSSLTQGLPWYAGYAKPEVLLAFDRFWANAPAPDGIGLQDHLASAWAAVARRFKSDPAVIGYDLLNEPYYGSDAINLATAALSQAPLLLTRSPFDPVFVEAVARAMSGPHGDFERTKLAPFYDRVRAAIRAEDPERILFLEPAALSNSGVPTSLPRPSDPNTALIPHYYDPQTLDGQSPYDGDPTRMEAALGRLAATWSGGPIVLGEFGNIRAGAQNGRAFMDDVFRVLDQHWAGAMWWEWGRGFAGRSDLDAIVRPYPQRVPGTPLSFRWDPAAKTLEVRYRIRSTDRAALVIAVPALQFPRGFDVLSSYPAGAWRHTFDPARNVLRVTHDPAATDLTVTVRAR